MIGVKMLVAFVLGWAIAQAAKLVTAMAKNPKLKGGEALRVAMKSGGMPSGHAASLAAMTMYLGLVAGFGSAIFALALCFTVIVLYDAVNVRWAVGEHGKILAKLAKGERVPRIVEGHTVMQVVAGVVVGVLVGGCVFLLVG